MKQERKEEFAYVSTFSFFFFWLTTINANKKGTHRVSPARNNSLQNKANGHRMKLYNKFQ